GFSVERDPQVLRGTAGLLHDVCAGYTPDAQVLVLNAAQLLAAPVTQLFAQLRSVNGDVTLASDHHHCATGVMLLTVKTLREVPAVGFYDLKEQLLPRLMDQGYSVK